MYPFQYRYFLTAAIALLFLLAACNKPTLVGNDLLEQDQSNVQFMDTLRIEATTVAEDSVKVFDPNPQNQLTGYFCGQFSDPDFGLTEATAYAQFRLSSLSPNFQNTTVDSILLRVAYDSLATYGDISSPQTLEVYRVTEDMSNQKTYYSNQTFGTGTLLGTLQNFVPQPKLKVPIYTLAGDTAALGNFLSVKLDNSFGAEILALDSASLSTNTNFISKIKGLAFKMKDQKPGMISLNLSSNLTVVRIYFKQDTTRRDFILNLPQTSSTLSSTRLVNFKHTFSPTVTAAFNDTAVGNQKLYLQGMAGPNLQIKFPNAPNLNPKIIVNKAELDLTVVESVENQLFFPPANLLIMAYKQEPNGSLTVVRDVILGGIGRGAGGFIETKTLAGNVVIRKYRLNLSEHFQRIIRGNVNDTVFISVYGKSEKAARSIICGPKHPKYPMKLNLSYTQL